MRLQKLIALATTLSRRAAEDAIKRGEVTVNGAVVTKMGTVIDSAVDKICLKERPLRIPRDKVYLAFYKPRKVLVTRRDPHGRATIWNFLDQWKTKLNAIGRLDYDSEGLLILTNDGSMINALTHPSHEIIKTYFVKVHGVPSTKALSQLKEGVNLSDGKTLPAQLKVVKTTGKNTWLEISIREGRNRQIRRMCEAVGHPVLKLKRIAIGPINLRAMKPGQSKILSQKEIHNLHLFAKQTAKYGPLTDEWTLL